MKKALYLFLALLLPGLVFVFLKYAGSNKFDIPVYHENGVTDPDNCGPFRQGAYVIPDSAWIGSGDVRRMANVVIFSEGTQLNEVEISEAILKELATTELNFVGESSLSPDSVVRAQWKRCVFLVRSPWQSVLFDSTGRIRGYYDLSSRDELDRLRVELKILLEQY